MSMCDFCCKNVSHEKKQEDPEKSSLSTANSFKSKRTKEQVAHRIYFLHMESSSMTSTTRRKDLNVLFIKLQN